MEWQEEKKINILINRLVAIAQKTNFNGHTYQTHKENIPFSLLINQRNTDQLMCDSLDLCLHTFNQQFYYSNTQKHMKNKQK